MARSLDFQVLLVLPLQEIFKPTHRQGSGHGDGVMRILDDAWCNRCCLTKHSEAPALDPSHAFKLSPCAALGFCYHEGEGLKAHRLHSNMAALLKPYLQAVRQKRKSSTDYVAPADLKKRKPIYPEARKALDSGFLVMRLAAGPSSLLPVTSSKRRIVTATGALWRNGFWPSQMQKAHPAGRKVIGCMLVT